MTQPTSIEMATDLYDILKETGLTEDAVSFDNHRFVARRNEGDLRHQIFRDNDPTPYGVIEPHRCEHRGNGWRLRVFEAGKMFSGACVSTYINALSHLRMAGLAAGEDHHG